MSWFRPLQSVLEALDRVVDRTAERFHEHVTPVVQRFAGRLDDLLEDTEEQLVSTVRGRVSALDDRLQQFMIARVDPLFGQLRSEQLGELGGLVLSEREAALNRKIGLSALVLVVVTAGGALYPPSLLVTMPLAFATMLPTYEAAISSVQQQRTVTYQVVSAVNVTGILLGGFYVPAMAASLLFVMGEKLLLITEDRTKKELISAFSQQPQTVWLLRDGKQECRPFAEVLPGDVIAVSAGGLLFGTLAVIGLRHPTTPPPAQSDPSDKADKADKPAAKKQVHWSLNSVPQGALVIRAADGEVLGTTPWVADRPAGDGMLDVKLRVSGYAERSIRLNLAGDESREEMLDVAAVKPKPPPRPPVRSPGGRSPGGSPKKNDNDAPRIVD